MLLICDLIDGRAQDISGHAEQSLLNANCEKLDGIEISRTQDKNINV